MHCIHAGEPYPPSPAPAPPPHAPGGTTQRTEASCRWLHTELAAVWLRRGPIWQAPISVSEPLQARPLTQMGVCDAADSKDPVMLGPALVPER